MNAKMPDALEQELKRLAKERQYDPFEVALIMTGAEGCFTELSTMIYALRGVIEDMLYMPPSGEINPKWKNFNTARAELKRHGFTKS